MKKFPLSRRDVEKHYEILLVTLFKIKSFHILEEADLMHDDDVNDDSSKALLPAKKKVSLFFKKGGWDWIQEEWARKSAQKKHFLKKRYWDTSVALQLHENA